MKKLNTLAIVAGTTLLCAAALGWSLDAAQAQTECDGGLCQQPNANVSTIYRYRTVPEVSNTNRYRDVTNTRYRDVTQTRYRDIPRVSYRDVTQTHYVRHINRIVTVTQVQPIVHVHEVTRVHHIVLTRVHTQVIPRVHVTVIPRVHTRTVVLNRNQYAAETRVLPTSYAMGTPRTVSAGTRMEGLYGYAGPQNLNQPVQPSVPPPQWWRPRE